MRKDTCVLVLLLALSSAMFGQGNGAKVLKPMLAASKVTPDNPLGLTIDHAAVSVASLDKVAGFYHDVLGFQELERGSWGPEVKYRILAIPGVFRIDLVQHAGSVRSVPAGKFDREQGLLHLCFDTTALDAAYQRFLAMKATMRINKSEAGTITEIFLIDPEGNEVEVKGY